MLLGAAAACGARAQGHTPAVDPAVAHGMHDAIAAAQGGDEQHALLIVGGLLAQHPAFEPALKLKGMLLEDTGHKEDAAAAYAAALKLAPNDPELLLKVGIIALLTGHLDQSVALLAHRVQVVPGDEEGNYYLAQAYHLKGNNELALASIRQAIKAAPDSPPVQQKYGELLCSAGQNDEALRWLLKAQAADATLHRINFDLAVATFGGMDLQGAEGYAAKQAALTPNDLDNLGLLASIQGKLSQWSDAEGNLKRVLAARGDDGASTLALGHCELELKNYEAAIDALHRSLQLDPTQALAHFFLSRAYAALGNTEEAQHEAALHREMLQHLPMNLPRAEEKREDALLEQARTSLANGHEEEARKILAQSKLDPAPTPASGWVSVGATYLSINNTEGAARSFQHALALDPKTRDAHTYLGVLALQGGDLVTAEKEFNAELANDPNNLNATGELGEVRYRQAQWPEAIELLTRSKTINPALLYMLCDAYFRVGNVKKADLIAESLTAYAKGQTQVLRSLAELLKRNNQAELANRLATKT